MILTAKRICSEIRKGNNNDPTGIAVVPMPDLDKIAQGGEASVNLRLGRWFLTLRQSSETHIEPTASGSKFENRISKKYFVPFGEAFVLHPGRFALASTLEWIKLPNNYAAFVVGKSTLGRRGIVIETAAGVHPGFLGCLTLEIANVGEVPVKLIAGMFICQLFFHCLQGELSGSVTSLAGQRKPRLGQIREDSVLERLKATIR